MHDKMSIILLEILDFWFSQENEPRWFVKDLQFDNTIRERYENIYEFAISKYQDKRFADIRTGKEALALVILFDQFSRNMFRDTPKAFATDNLALMVSKMAVEKKFDRQFTTLTNHNFLYMPYMHSENLKDQEEGIRLFSMLPGNARTISYAKQHYDIIARFGRFPHRNKVLGRKSTSEELTFLKAFKGF